MANDFFLKFNYYSLLRGQRHELKF